MRSTRSLVVRRLAAVVLALAAVGLAGCSSDDPDSDADSDDTSQGSESDDPDSDDPDTDAPDNELDCGLVGLDQVEQITGTTWTAAPETEMDSPYGQVTTCIFTGVDSPLDTVTITEWDGEEAFDTIDGDEIDGIGDRAVEGPINSIYFVVDGKTVMTQLYSIDAEDAAALDAASQLADAVIANL